MFVRTKSIIAAVAAAVLSAGSILSAATISYESPVFSSTTNESSNALYLSVSPDQPRLSGLKLDGGSIGAPGGTISFDYFIVESTIDGTGFLMKSPTDGTNRGGEWDDGTVIGSWRHVEVDLSVTPEPGNEAYDFKQLRIEMYTVPETTSLYLDNIQLTDENDTTLWSYDFESDTIGDSPFGTGDYGFNVQEVAVNPTAAAVPEPAALSLVATAGLFLFRRRR